LEQIRTRKIMAVQLPADQAATVRTLARWNNASSSPAALSKDWGSGRVLLWTVTADKEWSDWPTEPSYVLAVREAAKAIARADSIGRALTAGEKIQRLLPPGQQPTAPVIEVPGAEAPLALQIEHKHETVAGLEQPLKALTFSDTSRAGLYTLSWGNAQTGTQHDVFAVNPDRRESELARIPAAELKKLFGAIEPDVISAVSGSDMPIAVRGQEIWRSLAAVLLGLLAVEACFATWAGRQR
jgi:hypothetical protein